MSAWKGHLMVDDYAGYKTLFASNGHKETCIEPACLAHARRKFFDLHGANQSPIAWEALQRIGALYAIEAKGKELGMMRGSSCVGKKACPNFMLSMTGSYRPVSSPPTAAL
ncbi:MAG: transposase [Methylobacter sp.]|nr:transposase [Methylobacter sp.]